MTIPPRDTKEMKVMAKKDLMGKIVKLTKKVVFKKLGGYTLYPGTNLAVVLNNDKHVFGIPVDNAVALRITPKYYGELLGGLPIARGLVEVL